MFKYITPAAPPKDVERCCRICLLNYTKMPYFSLFTKTLPDSDIRLCDALQQLTSVKFCLNDGLPIRICASCESRVIDAYALKLQTERNTEKLMEIVENKKQGLYEVEEDLNLAEDIIFDEQIETLESAITVSNKNGKESNLSEQNKSQIIIIEPTTSNKISNSRMSTNQRGKVKEPTIATTPMPPRKRGRPPTKRTTKVEVDELIELLESDKVSELHLDNESSLSDTVELIECESEQEYEIDEEKIVQEEKPQNRRRKASKSPVKRKDEIEMTRFKRECIKDISTGEEEEDDDDDDDEQQDDNVKFKIELQNDSNINSSPTTPTTTPTTTSSSKSSSSLSTTTTTTSSTKSSSSSTTTPTTTTTTSPSKSSSASSSTTTTTTPKATNKSYTERKYTCNVCSKKFIGKSNLIEHLRLHAKLKPFECEYCGKRFVQSGNYMVHLRIHTKERPYKCTMCPNTYNQSSALTVHIRSHTNERNYKCNVCPKAFTNSSDLKKHQRIHNDFDKFECVHCKRLFNQKSNMLKHIRAKHAMDTS